MSGELTGQVAIVTGGGRGIGRAIARVLAAAGAAVTVTARSEHELAETVAVIEGAGGRALAMPADVTDSQAAARVVAETVQRLGPVDLLVNNAGMLGPGGPLWETDPDTWWRTQAVNLYGPFLWARAVLPGMVARMGGRIINVVSGGGLRGYPYCSAYVTSKTALLRMTECIALEAGEHGVNVFAMDPGGVRTAMLDELDASPWVDRVFPGRSSSPRLTTPPDRAAQLCRFLASGKADALSGRMLSVSDDEAALARQAEAIVQEERLTLRLKT